MALPFRLSLCGVGVATERSAAWWPCVGQVEQGQEPLFEPIVARDYRAVADEPRSD
jgi:hypothetical protein